MKNENIVILAIAGFVLGWVLFLVGTAVKADDSPPSTRLEVCRGSLPSLSVEHSAQYGCVPYTVTSIDPANPDHLVKNDDWNNFRHVYFKGGDPACVGTLKNGRLDSGRDADVGGDSQVAYIVEGFGLYAVTGGSCSEHKVPQCGGPFCR